MTRKLVFSLAIVLAICASVPATSAGEDDGDSVFAQLGDAVVTQQLLDAAFARIPVRDRLSFIRDGQKVDMMVKNILLNQALANAARAAGFDQDPLVTGRVKLAADKALADAWLDERVERTPDADFEALAQEYYLLHKSDFQASPTFDVTHLLVATGERSEQEAEALARDYLSQIRQDPQRFDELVAAHSDDPSAAANKGRFEGVKQGQMAEPFEQAAMALKQVGDISDLVRTRFGYHIIRLDGRQAARQQEFDEVRDRLVDMQRTDYLENVRLRVISEITSQPLVVPEGAVEAMLKRYFGEDLENAPYRGG